MVYENARLNRAMVGQTDDLEDERGAWNSGVVVKCVEIRKNPRGEGGALARP